MTYPTVSLNGNDYPVFGSVSDADAYLVASMTADAWNVPADDDTKAKALISASRWLNSLTWLGTPTDSSQALAWPRTSVSGVDSGAIPTDVANACFELAAGLVDDPTLFTSLNDPNPSSIRAGSVSVTYFRPLDVQWLGVVPKAALALIRKYLNTANFAGGPVTSGTTDTNTTFGGDNNFDLYRGL